MSELSIEYDSRDYGTVYHGLKPVIMSFGKIERGNYNDYQRELEKGNYQVGVNGTMIRVRKYKGVIHVSTNGKIDAFTSFRFEKSFGDMFISYFNNDLNSIPYLDTDFTHFFILVINSPDNFLRKEQKERLLYIGSLNTELKFEKFEFPSFEEHSLIPQNQNEEAFIIKRYFTKTGKYLKTVMFPNQKYYELERMRDGTNNINIFFLKLISGNVPYNNLFKFSDFSKVLNNEEPEKTEEVNLFYNFIYCLPYKFRNENLYRLEYFNREINSLQLFLFDLNYNRVHYNLKQFCMGVNLEGCLMFLKNNHRNPLIYYQNPLSCFQKVPYYTINKMLSELRNYINALVSNQKCLQPSHDQKSIC